jgi:hypothetical protein
LYFSDRRRRVARNIQLPFYCLAALERHCELSMREVMRNCEVYAPGVDVCYNDCARALYLRHGCDEEAYGAGAEDEDCGVWGEGGAFEGLDCDAEGLEEGAEIEGYGFGESGMC